MNSDGRYARQATAAANEVLSKHDVDGETLKADFVANVLEVFASHGLLTFQFSDPANRGALPGDMAKACQIISTLAKRSGTLATIYMVNGLLAPLCVSYAGTPEQKAHLLPQVALGKLQLVFALTEPGAGSDAAGITTCATM